MTTISFKSNSPDIIIPLLKNAIEREKRILMETLRIIREKVDRMAKNLNVNVERVMSGEVEHTESNDMDLIELEGEVEILKHHEAELRELESVEICK